MARIFFAVVREEGLVHRVISQCGLSTTHEITVSETLTAAYRSLESEHFDLVVCDVGFDESQMFDIWAVTFGANWRGFFGVIWHGLGWIS